MLNFLKSVINTTIDNNLMERGNIPKFKVLLIGPPGVGKTSLLMKYVFNKFSYDYQVTTGIQMKTKQVNINQKNSIQLQLWDTMGQQAFKSIVKSSYKGVSAVIFFYSIEKKENFQKLAIWVRQVKENVHEETVFFLLATKLDLQDVRKVKKQEGEAYAKKINAECFQQISSKTGQNIKEAFDKIAKNLFKKYSSSRSFKQFVKPKLDLNKTESFRLKKIDGLKPTKKEEGSCC